MVAKLVSAIAAVNDAAHAFDHDRPLRRRIFQSKNELVSLAIEQQVPSIHVSWHRNSDGEWLLLVKFDERKGIHVPFERLSVTARMRVVNTIGPAPQ